MANTWSSGKYKTEAARFLVATKRWSVRPSVCDAFASRPSRSDVCRVYGLVKKTTDLEDAVL